MALKPVVRDSPKTALAQAEKVYRGLNEDWDAAREAGQTGVVLAISKELRPAIELGAKLSGELNERPQHLTLNLLANDQFMEVVKMIVETWEDHPEAKQALIRSCGCSTRRRGGIMTDLKEARARWVAAQEAVWLARRRVAFLQDDLIAAMAQEAAAREEETHWLRTLRPMVAGNLRAFLVAAEEEAS